MHDKSKVTRGGKPEVKLSGATLNRWFKKQGGKEKSPLEKPYLSDDQKKNRVNWSHNELKRITDHGNNFYCAFVDEKWFYTTSRRRKIKILPAGPFEDPEKVKPKIPRCISRRHPMKVCKLLYVFFSRCTDGTISSTILKLVKLFYRRMIPRRFIVV